MHCIRYINILSLPFFTQYNAISDIINAEILLNGTTFQLHTPARGSAIAKIVHKEMVEPSYLIHWN